MLLPESVIFAGLPQATCDMFSFPRGTVVRRIGSADEVVAAGIANRRIAREPLYWSRTYIGVGVLQALRSRRRISFAEMQPPRTSIDMDSSHIVVCEDGDAHSQVVAAAYALSIDAGLRVIPEFPRDEADLEDLRLAGDRTRTLQSMVGFLESELRVLDDVERRGTFRA